MRVLVYRHVPFEHLGRIASALETKCVEFRYTDPFEHDSATGLDSAAALIFMGGPMSANDDTPALRREVEIIRMAKSAGKPMLGICLGAQLIVKALGGRVFRNPVKEIGWYPVEFLPAAREDRLFAGIDGPEVVFHWHGETFDLPPGAEWLARSRDCAHQAYRLDGGVYGLQFHLEATPEMIAAWCREDVNCCDVAELKAPLDPQRHAARLQEVSATVFGRWVDLVKAGSL